MNLAFRHLTYGLRLLMREWRAGELHVLVAALVVAVATVTAVGFFTDRVERAMTLQASELLAADTLLRSTVPIDETKVEAAHLLGLDTARTLDFRSVLLVGDIFQLAEVKAVSPDYPLRGTLKIASTAFEIDPPGTDSIPSRGTVWLDEQLMSLLSVNPGDSLALGDKRFRIESILAYEPDRGGDLFSIAPRLMMHLDDVAATNLVTPASRVTHSVLFSGPAELIGSYREMMTPTLTDREHFRGLEDARPEIRVAMERADQFLGLAALVSVMLSGAAIGVSSRRYANRRLDAAAIMRCLGASQGIISRIYMFQVFTLGFVASLLGCIVGYLAQLMLAMLFADLLLGHLPPPSLTPVLIGLMTGLLTLAGFAVPPIVGLTTVAPIRVLRRDLGNLPALSWAIMLAPLGALMLLILWQAKDWRLAIYVLCGGLLSLGALSLAAFVLIKLLRRLRSRVGVAFRFGLSNITRRAPSSVLQVTAFGLGMMMLLLITIVRGDILGEWRRNLPPETPNFFLINIQPPQVDSLKAWLKSKGLGDIDLYPMVRARLTDINNRKVDIERYEQERARRLARREFNLSWANRLPLDNRVVSGTWWKTDARVHEFSIEVELADTLGINLGDQLTFDVAGQHVVGKVTSLRFVEWDSFNVNFFVVSPPSLLRDYPATYIGSFYLPAHQRSSVVELIGQFPSLSVLDVEALLSKVRQIMERVVLGVEYVFLFTVLSGVIVLMAAIESTMDERRYETALIRTLGGQRRALISGLLAEFTTLGCLAGALAALAATLVGAVISEHIFQLNYHPNISILIVGTLAGGVGIGIGGLLRARSALKHPPIEVMRSR